MEVFICSEATINDARQALERGGVWLTVEYDHSCALYYLDPEQLIAWIEGAPISTLAKFPELSDGDRQHAFRLLEEKLHSVVQCPKATSAGSEPH